VIPCITGDENCEGGLQMSQWVWFPICMAIYVPLVMVRKIEVFASFHIFADIMIIVSIITIFGYAGKSLGTDGI